MKPPRKSLNATMSDVMAAAAALDDVRPAASSPSPAASEPNQPRPGAPGVVHPPGATPSQSDQVRPTTFDGNDARPGASEAARAHAPLAVEMEQARPGADGPNDVRPAANGLARAVPDGRTLRATGRTHQFSTRIKEETHDAIKLLAVQQKITIGELVERMLEAYLSASKKSSS